MQITSDSRVEGQMAATVAAIAATVEALRWILSCPALCKWLLAYANKAYPAGAASGNVAIGQSILVVDKNELAVEALAEATPQLPVLMQ